MTDLFTTKPKPPLAELLRPKTLDEFVGQRHLLGPGKPLRLAFEAGKLHSFILWGPPGVGKTTLGGTVAKLAMRQPFVLFKGLTFQKLCLPGAFRPGDHHNKMLRPGLCVVHASPQYL